MFGLVVIKVMTPSGHLSNINEILMKEHIFVSVIKVFLHSEEGSICLFIVFPCTKV